MSIDANLVILSACSSGFSITPDRVKQSNDGEPLSALATAFFEAGARGIMVSSWAIDTDRTTKLLMSVATARIARPKSRPAEILRDGMLAQISEGSHPRDWAMFTYIGY